MPPGLTAEIDRHGNIVVDCTKRQEEPAEEATGLATPVLMRVMGGAFQSIAKEMGAILFRISYSSIIRESEDLGAGLFDIEGNEIAESDSTPMFMGAMPKIVKGVIGELGLDGIHEGDIIAHNHPYKGATHTPDIGIVVPIFWEGELIGFSGASAHLLDIGGAYPGMAIDLVDMWAEGQVLDAVKLSERGVRQESVWKMMLTNVRTPTHNRGDIEAMIAASSAARNACSSSCAATARRPCSAPPAPGSTTRSGCCARRSRRCRTACTRPRSATWTTTGRTAGSSYRSR